MVGSQTQDTLKRQMGIVQFNVSIGFQKNVCTPL